MGAKSDIDVFVECDPANRLAAPHHRESSTSSRMIWSAVDITTGVPSDLPRSHLSEAVNGDGAERRPTPPLVY
jgi:hypothetical protein